MKLMFPVSEIRVYASKYPIVSDERIQQLVPDVRDRGYLTLSDLIELSKWKVVANNNHRNIIKNEKVIVEGITRYAFITNSEHERIDRLCDLYGVGIPVASAILHWFHSDDYPIMDTRAETSVQYDYNAYKSEFTGWRAYTKFCRKLAEEARVDMRTLDRALYMYEPE